MSTNSVYSRGMVPHTCIAMASSVRIFSKNADTGQFAQIGLIQSFRPNDTRRMERARGVGFGDRVAEIVPGTTDTQITVTRMAMYEENILESFGYHTGFNKGGTRGSVRSLSHLKNPFDINEVIVFHARQGDPTLNSLPGGNERLGFFPTEYTSFWYHDCWPSTWSRTIDITGNLIYMEDVTIDVTWVSDGLEPGPYQDTDVWDTHGLNCSSRCFNAAGVDTDSFLDGIANGSAQTTGISNSTFTTQTSETRVTSNVFGGHGSSRRHKSFAEVSF